MIDDPRYAKINAMWKAAPPLPCTDIQARRMRKKLYRTFGLYVLGGPQMRRDKRYPRGLKAGDYVRRCWTSAKPRNGNSWGWGRLAHDVSHEINRRRYPTVRDHDITQARLEWEITCFVVANLIEGTV